MNHHQELLVGAPIEISVLIKDLQAAAELPTPETLPDLLGRYQQIESLFFHFCMLCEDVGHDDPDISGAKERFAPLLEKNMTELKAVVLSDAMVRETEGQVRKAVRRLPRVLTPGRIIAAIDLSQESPIPARLFDLVRLQHTLIEVPDERAVLRIPRWMGGWCLTASGTLFDPLEEDETSVEVLSTALTLWEPYDERSPYASFTAAVHAARII
jgi:hypothetical protein